MVNLQRVKARVAEELAERQLQAELAQNTRERRVLHLNASLQTVRTTLASYGISDYQMGVRTPITINISGEDMTAGYTDVVYFSTNTDAEELLTFQAAALLEAALSKAAEVVENLTEDELVQLWLKELVENRHYTLRSMLGVKTAPDAA